jgi:hypothetical protein
MFTQVACSSHFHPGDAFTSQILYQLSLSNNKSTQAISSHILLAESIANISSVSFNSCA